MHSRYEMQADTQTRCAYKTGERGRDREREGGEGGGAGRGIGTGKTRNAETYQRVQTVLVAVCINVDSFFALRMDTHSSS